MLIVEQLLNSEHSAIIQRKPFFQQRRTQCLHQLNPGNKFVRARHRQSVYSSTLSLRTSSLAFQVACSSFSAACSRSELDGMATGAHRIVSDRRKSLATLHMHACFPPKEGGSHALPYGMHFYPALLYKCRSNGRISLLMSSMSLLRDHDAGVRKRK
jgi:hypothetical protein